MNRISIINSMCGTFDHSYGLMPKESKDFLFRRMAQIYDNDIAPNMSIKIDKAVKESLDNVNPIHDYTSNGADESSYPLCGVSVNIKDSHNFSPSFSEFDHKDVL